MTDFSEGVSPEVARLALEEIDDADLAVLSDVRAVFEQVDPMPTDLVERVKFGLALDEVFTEVAEITRMPMDALAVRNDATLGTRTETLTFSAERITAMVTVSRVAGTVRIDGWIAPPGAIEVRLRMHDERRSVVADNSGRFVFNGLSEGFAQLTFVLDDSADDPASVIVTPLFQL